MLNNPEHPIEDQSVVEQNKYIVIKDQSFIVNKVVSNDNPYDTLDEFMIEELFFENSY